VEPDSFFLALGAALATAALAAASAAEVGLQRASRVRLQALAAQGDRRAARLVGTAERPRPLDELLAPLVFARSGLGATVVTLAALAGYAASPHGVVWGAVAGLAAAVAAQTAAAALAAPRPEVAALRLSFLPAAARRAFGLPAMVLALPARLTAGRPAPSASDREDLIALMEREEAAGGVEEEERRMIRGIIALEEKTAREIMVPRIDIVAADIEASVRDVAQLIVERGFSRIPVYRGSIDEIVGIAYAKDLLRALTNGGEPRLEDLLRQPYFVPESKRLDELLAELRRLRVHMAIVVDEYGGTAGLVTIEDLIEEIVGEIEDEYDVARSVMEVVSEDEVVLDAGVPTDVLEELFGFRVESEEFDTLAGLVLHELGRVPRVGDEVSVGPLVIRVEMMSGRRVRRVRVRRVEARDERLPDESRTVLPPRAAELTDRL
jgi:putative hemolysin